MLTSRFKLSRIRLFVDLNVARNGQATDVWNNKCMQKSIKNLQNVYFPDEHPNSGLTFFMKTNSQNNNNPKSISFGSGDD